MIRVKFKEPETKTWRRWVKDCETATADLRVKYEGGKSVEVTKLYRRKSIKEEVYFSKVGPFRGRCAYCESYIADFQHGDIEHFRPKRAVTDENDAPVMITNPDGTTREHPGYYWLAYTWRNLLPSCITCNQPGEEGIGKRSRFPLERPKYAIKEEEIADERPLLLNPVDPNDEDPEDHLDIDLETGLMTFRNNSKRGEMCIKVFGLNKRDQLVKERIAAIEQIKAKYVKLIMVDDDAKAQVVHQEIKEMEQGSLSYTLARRAQSRKTRERMGYK